jgi:4-hydroxybenzoyl-CoA reductase subunit beta
MNGKYNQPETLKEALMLASGNADSVFVAGGTDVFVNKQQGNITADLLIDISGIDELKKIEKKENNLVIGSLVKLSEIIENEEIIARFPALKEAALSVASPVIRKTATIGGNVLCENRCIFYNQSEWWRKAVGYCLKCNGDICIATGGKKNCFSKFVSDTAPVFIAYNALVTISGNNEEHVFPLEELYTGDGINPLKKEKNTILKNIILPLDKVYKAVFKKLRPRKTLDFTSLTTVVSIDENEDIRIVIGGVDPMPVLTKGNKKDDILELLKKAAKKPRVVDNDYYSRKYRKEMISLFARNSLDELLNIIRDEENKDSGWQ